MSDLHSSSAPEARPNGNQPTTKSGGATKRFFGNAAALLTSDLLNKATTFLVYAFVARTLDDDGESFGQLVLGLTLFYVFQVIATAGLPNLLTREVAKRNALTPQLIAGGLAATCVTACLALVGMQFTALALQYKEETTRVIQVLSVGLVPYSLALIFEAAFRGNERMHYIAVSNLLANLVKVAGAMAILSAGKGVLWIAALIVGVRSLILLCDAACYFFVARYQLAKPIRSHISALLSRSIPFLGIDIVIALWGAVDGVLLSKMMTEAEVGIYGAAGQLLQPVALVYRSIVGSVFPSMCRRASSSAAQLLAFTRWMLAFLLLIGLPVTILIPVFADMLLALAYGIGRFEGAIPVMRITAFGLIAHSFTVVLGHALWAANREHSTLRIVIVNFGLNILVSSIGIYYFGILGAACGSLIVVVVNVLQHAWALRHVVAQIPIDNQVVPPLLAAAAMLVTILLLHNTNRFIAAGLGVIVYTSLAASLLVRHHGSIENCKNRFFAPLAN